MRCHVIPRRHAEKERRKCNILLPATHKQSTWQQKDKQKHKVKCLRDSKQDSTLAKAETRTQQQITQHNNRK